MLTYTITGDNVSISEEIREYVGRHYKTFERFLDPMEDREIDLVVSKVTAHERDDMYRVEAQFMFRLGDFFATATAPDIMTGINEVKEELMREVTAMKGKKRTMIRRGAQKMKQIAKGIFRKTK